jgi:two-component system chemotaxis sensor kinase CheA
MDDLLNEFLAETNESIERLDGDLVTLEKNPDDPDLLSSIFRVLHTIKGTCGFLGLPRLEKLAHSGENVLGNFRDGSLTVTPAAMNPVLAALDRLKHIVATLEQTGQEPAGDDSDLIAALDHVYKGGLQADAAAVPARDAAPEPAADVNIYDAIGGLSTIDAVVDVFYRKVLDDPLTAPYFDDVDIDRLQGMQRAFFAMALGGPDEYSGKDLTKAHAHLVEAGLDDSHFDAVAGHLQAALGELEVPADIRQAIMNKVGGTRDAVLGRTAEAEPGVADAVAPVEETKTPAEESKSTVDAKGGGVTKSIRVNVDVLETLMTVVSELVLTRNQLLQILRDQKDSEFTAPLQRLNQVTSELQESVMQTRMQPIGNAWAKLPRIVRDLSQELGKKVELVMHGAETELDRQVLDEIKDPLTHMVRNAADHGLESTENRLKAGKSEVGRIYLSARHEGGHIVLEIADDGSGLNTARIREKMIANGLASEAELEAMTDQQIQQFIFKPGFSTAAAVTSVSGRGVGMDVVRSNIAKIGGAIELNSVAGKGTRFTIKIPLTLAIVSALIVEAGGQRFALPQSSVVELVRVSGESAKGIEVINRTPVLRLRNRLLPLVSLQKMLRLEVQEGTDESYIIVAQVGSYMFGIVVDKVFDTEEIVVKPVSGMLKEIGCYSGNTILGDGSVIMILDPNGIANANSQVTTNDDQSLYDDETEGFQREATAMLVFTAGRGAPKAVPLGLVARIEEIDVANIEAVDGQFVVQYRGHLMPLLLLSDDYGFRDSGKQPVLVFADRDRAIGLVTEEIIDIVEADIDIEIRGGRDGVMGTGVIAGRSTELIDASHYIRNAAIDWFDIQREKGYGETVNKRVLLVDDSSFFRNLLCPILESAGYRVTQANNGENGLKVARADDGFDIVISDLEMPVLDGFGFVSKLRETPGFQTTPVFALSSHASPKDVERCHAAGFSSHVEKLDRERLLVLITQSFSDRDIKEVA